MERITPVYTAQPTQEVECPRCKAEISTLRYAVRTHGACDIMLKTPKLRLSNYEDDNWEYPHAYFCPECGAELTQEELKEMNIED